MKVIVFLIVLAALIYIGTTRNEEKRMAETPRSESAQEKSNVPKRSAQQNSTASSNSAVSGSALSALDKQLQAIAAKNNVRVTLGQKQDQSQRVHVEWSGDVATLGGDYIMALFRNKLIKDFDPVGKGQRSTDQAGRSVWSQDYDLKLR